MSNCDFCEGKVIKSNGSGNGIKTMMSMFSSFMGLGNDYDESDRAEDGIMLINGNILAFDNSSGEYAEMYIPIRFCPLCGKRLENSDEDRSD